MTSLQSLGSVKILSSSNAIKDFLINLKVSRCVEMANAIQNTFRFLRLFFQQMLNAYHAASLQWVTACHVFESVLRVWLHAGGSFLNGRVKNNLCLKYHYSLNI